MRTTRLFILLIVSVLIAGTSGVALADRDQVSGQAGDEASDKAADATFRDNEFTDTSGKALFNHICTGCHMDGGKGASQVGQYPALANNPKLGASSYVSYMVTYGNLGMPGFGGFLDDEQIAAVVNYVRHNLGNDFDGRITAEDVAAARDSSKTDDPLE